jgi:3-dehydroquinate synthetase
LLKSGEVLWKAMQNDKKRIEGKLEFIVPGEEGVKIVSEADIPCNEENLIYRIINGEHPA